MVTAMYPKEFSAVFAIGLVLICVYLLLTGKLGGWQFGFALFASAFVVIGVHNIDEIRTFTVKGGGAEAIMEIRELRNEVFAKVDELKKVAAGIATFTVESIVLENRWTDQTRQEQALRRRDKLATFLRDTGLSEPQIAETISPITRITDWDMRRAIVVDAVAAWRVPKGGDPNDTRPREEFQRELERILQQPDRLEALSEVEPKIKHLYDPANPQLISAIAAYRAMLMDGRLPKVGSADDMTRAPIE
jgi:hypothetical protein